MEESELIDKFLKNELTDKETGEVNSRIQFDEGFQKKVALRKLVIAGIAEAYAEELKVRLKNFDRSLENKNRFQFSWKIAAVFAGIILVASAIFFLSQKPSPYDFDLAEAGLPNTMGKTENIVFQNAMSEFKSKNYTSSGKTFNELLQSQKKNDTLLYFSGLCDFRTKQNESAIKKLNAVSIQSGFYEKAQYRLALCYWIEGNKVEAIKALEEIKGENLKNEASKVLQALR